MDEFVSVLRAFADETRFRIIQLLLTHDLCVGALARRPGVSSAAVSQHLQILRRAGLVRGEKRGYWTHYVVNRALLHQTANQMIRHANLSRGSEEICHRSLQNQINVQERRELVVMCKDCCEHPEKLRGKPAECTLEQIKECHGDTKEHPCESEDK